MPLADRRYHDNFNIYKKGEDVIISAYGADLIQYKHDADYIVINESGRWLDSAYLHVLRAVLRIDFMPEIANKFSLYLGKVGDRSFRDKYVFYRRSKFILSFANGDWHLPEPPVLYTYHLDRTQANNVRQTVKAFAEYMERMIKVKEPLRSSDEKLPVYVITLEEIKQALDKDLGHLHVSNWRVLAHKPTQGDAKLTEHWEMYVNWANRFMRMVTSGDLKEFYKAMMIIAVCTPHPVFNEQFACTVPQMLNTLDEIVLKANSRTVFKLVQVPQGQVPSDKYEKYAFWLG